jgi:carbon-monoxide dehydrogenase large subunit
MMLAVQADQSTITTAAGLGAGEALHPLLTTFHEHHALQCGFCTPGILCAAADLLQQIPNPNERDVREGLRGNLCRCTGYQHIVEAVLDASRPVEANQSGDDGMSDGSPWKGRALPRFEDARFLTGRGRYVDDIVLPNQLYAVFVRSPHPYGRVQVNAAAARSMPGVVAAYTGSDLAELSDVPPNWVLPGTRPRGRPPMARASVRHVGESVAVVVAESLTAAVDASEEIETRYEALAHVLDQRAALAPGAPRVHEDLPDNQATVFRVGNGGFDDAAANADRTISFELSNQRVVPYAIEPRVVNADFNPATGKLTLHIPQQIPHMLRRMLASALKFPEHKLRVLSPDVGGGFGPKMHFYPEELVLSHISRQLCRPVKWTETRRENIVATTHGRDHVMNIDVAAQRDGTILALRIKSTANVGAYLSSMGSGVPTVNVALFALGIYAIPHAEVLIQCAYTHTTPVDAYRGAGRPEAAYVIERTIDRVAHELGLDPVEVRLRNMVRPEQLPYQQPVGALLDSGQYALALRDALGKVDYTKLRREQAEARSSGRLLGIGLATYTHTVGMGMAEQLARIGFDRGGFESALVRVHTDGKATILSGSHNHGQGHATTFAQIAADELGIPPQNIEVIQGDTDAVPMGTGTFNSRSIAVGGTAVKNAAARVAARMRRIAAHLTQSTPERIAFDGVLFRVTDTNASIPLADVARAAWTGQNLPRDIGIGLEETEFYHPTAMSSPYGTHVAVVEVDKETGEVAVHRYLALEDCGNVVNPLLARGQLHGGIAQGLGQALYEGAFYDAHGVPTDNPAIPRFDTTPHIETAFMTTPTATNPLGAKGIGEGSAVGAPPAIVNAAIDALWHLGVRALDMPLTPERVFGAIHASEGRARG